MYFDFNSVFAETRGMQTRSYVQKVVNFSEKVCSKTRFFQYFKQGF
jgi:hypothetical protein